MPHDVYYAKALPARVWPSLAGERTADVCVIGGGLTGLSAALSLAEAGVKTVLLEAGAIGGAASGRNGGQIHTGLRQSQSRLEAWLGQGHARDLWALSQAAKVLVAERIARHAIACDGRPGLIIAAHNRAALAHLAEETAHLAEAYDYTAARMAGAEEAMALTGSPLYAGARVDHGGGHLQPLAFLRGLASAAEQAGAELFENSAALAIETAADGVRIRLKNGAVRAAKIIVATDNWTASLLPHVKPYLARVHSFIAATPPLPAATRPAILPGDEAVADTRHALDYYRKSADGRLLFSAGERVFRLPRAIEPVVRPRLETVFPQIKGIAFDFTWSGIVSLTRTRMPHFGRCGERVLFAYGYSGQGVAMATLGGALLAEAAMGRPERFEVFARVPARPFPGGPFRQLAVGAALLGYRALDML